MSVVPPRTGVIALANGGWHLDGFVNYSAVLKKAGYEALALVVEELTASASAKEDRTGRRRCRLGGVHRD